MDQTKTKIRSADQELNCNGSHQPLDFKHENLLQSRGVRSKKKTLHLVLIKPSKYDENGYIIQYRKGVMPINTLAVLYGLTLDAAASGLLGSDTKLKVDLIDEIVNPVKIKKIIRHSRKKNTQLLTCLCGIQSNQFARATDIALELRQHNITVAMGGFHISGTMALQEKLSPELELLKNHGVTLVAGEVEETWGAFLQDFLNHKLKPIYNYMDQKPSLSFSAFPVVPKSFMKRYFLSGYGTIDLGRGCPFNCSFCCIINVQGKKMRFRSIDTLKKMLKENYLKNNIKNYFFTDDNFSRNQNWEKICDILIDLRENEDIPLQFMMQIDTKAYKIPNFVQKASRAGCQQAFIGIESLNPENLAAVGKVQNEIERYKEMNELLMSHSIMTHSAYIIGFPNDTEESIRKNIRQLLDIGFCQASFFILTPLPGSVDHQELVNQKVPLDADFNNYDTFNNQVKAHPHLKNNRLIELYQEAWQSFLSLENMKKILSRIEDPARYYGQLGNLFWYKHAVDVDEMHPMVSGFLRIKDRQTRRNTFKKEGFFNFYLKRTREILSKIKRLFILIGEFEEVWLQTRPRTKIETNIVTELARMEAGIKKRICFKDFLKALNQAGIKKRSLKVRYILKRLFFPFLIPLDQKLLYTRQFLNHYWALNREHFKRKNILGINFFKLIRSIFYEIQMALSFGYSFIKTK